MSTLLNISSCLIRPHWHEVREEGRVMIYIKCAYPLGRLATEDNEITFCTQ